MLSSKEYVKRSGNECPYCGSRDLSAVEPPGFDGTSCWRGVICDACGKEWNDIYELQGFEKV